MLPPTGHEPSLTRRRRVAAAVGLSLAVHLVGLLAFLALGVGPAGGPGGGEPDPAEYVMVTGEADWLAAGAPDPALPSSAPSAAPAAPQDRGGGAAGSPERRRPGPRRARAVAPPPGGSLPGVPTARVDPAPAPPRSDPAAEAARAAFRAELRRRLKETWRSYEVYRRIDPANRMQGSLFTSVVQVRLRADGKIERSELSSSSGVPAIDQQALSALTQLKPLPPVPPHMLDAEGGLTVNCKFFLDVGMFLFAAKIRAAIEGLWRPSRAFASSADDTERTTVLRLLIARDGKLVSTNVISSAGIDLLDENARRPLTPGTPLPIPPPAFTRQPGPAQVFVAFAHKAGQVRVLKPREDIEEE